MGSTIGVREGRIAEVAAYCETDVVNTYRVSLGYKLSCGRVTENCPARPARFVSLSRLAGAARQPVQLITMINV
jgi:hypothetical protein